MNAGLTCQFAHPWDLAPVSSVPYFVKSFCDLIEFANGDAKTVAFGGGSEFKTEVPAYSLTVFRFKAR